MESKIYYISKRLSGNGDWLAFGTLRASKVRKDEKKKGCHENRIVWERAKKEICIDLLSEDNCLRKPHACFGLWPKFLFHDVAFGAIFQNNAALYAIFVARWKFCHFYQILI